MYVKAMKKARKLVGPMNGNFYMKYDGARRSKFSHVSYEDFVQCRRVLGDRCKQYMSTTNQEGKMVGGIFDGSDVNVHKVRDHERREKKKLTRRAIKKIRRDKELKQYMDKPLWARQGTTLKTLAQDADAEDSE